MKASFRKYTLQFKRPATTSRETMTRKESWFLILEAGGRYGIGECGLFKGLSCDDVPDYEAQLGQVCHKLEAGWHPEPDALRKFPSIRFGLEQALQSLHSENPFLLFPSGFTHGEDSIPINGLIWMGEKAYMLQQIREKLEEGYRCLKLKIGALDFREEWQLLRMVRKEYTAREISLRVDANGAFRPGEALEKLKKLSELELHSIEQPIMKGQWEEMAALCAASPLPIALDEELIGVTEPAEMHSLVRTLNPGYLILKPSLLGGYSGCEDWMEAAQAAGTGWWVTSALESNIGLNAIAQWTYQQQPAIPQGLGTGALFTNNFSSPLTVGSGCLTYDPGQTWSQQIFKELCI